MSIKQFKPYTHARRFMSIQERKDITTDVPERSLLEPLRKSGGRNNRGRITMRHIGGGHRRLYRLIDFKRNKTGVQGKVATIEYDPNRNARIALVHYSDGDKRYIIAPKDLKVGSTVISGPEADITPGNALKLRDIPIGTIIHNLELEPGRGAKLVRAAGTSAQLMAKDGKYAYIRMPSGELRLILQECMASIGQVGNEDYENISLGKAGKSRWLGIRPTVRGMVMNPVDHPMGGGEGRSKGNKHPVSPWGTPAKGYRTRKKKPSDRLIVRRRYAK